MQSFFLLFSYFFDSRLPRTNGPWPVYGNETVGSIVDFWNHIRKWNWNSTVALLVRVVWFFRFWIFSESLSFCQLLGSSHFMSKLDIENQFIFWVMIAFQAIFFHILLNRIIHRWWPNEKWLRFKGIGTTMKPLEMACMACCSYVVTQL